MLRLLLRSAVDRSGPLGSVVSTSCLSTKKTEEAKKSREKIVREKTPTGKLDDSVKDKHRDAEKEPLPKWPDGVNPKTGERGGPAGPEPTRYGDWERKGRVTDF